MTRREFCKEAIRCSVATYISSSFLGCFLAYAGTDPPMLEDAVAIAKNVMKDPDRKQETSVRDKRFGINGDKIGNSFNYFKELKEGDTTYKIRFEDKDPNANEGYYTHDVEPVPVPHFADGKPGRYDTLEIEIKTPKERSSFVDLGLDGFLKATTNDTWSVKGVKPFSLGDGSGYLPENLRKVHEEYLKVLPQVRKALEKI